MYGYDIKLECEDLLGLLSKNDEVPTRHSLQKL